MCGATSTIPWPQLYYCCQCDQVLLGQSNWFHTGELLPRNVEEIFSVNFDMVWQITNSTIKEQGMAKNLPSNRKLPGIFTFNLFSGSCDAGDTAEEPLGGLKGHPGLL